MRKILSFAAFLVSLCSWSQTVKYTPYQECYVDVASYSGNIVVDEYADLNGQTYRVTGIADYAFRGCKEVTSVKMPLSIKRIGQYAFAGTGIKSITIPQNCREIDSYAFWIDCLQNIYVDENNPFFCSYQSGLFDKRMTVFYKMPAECSQEVFEIPEGVKVLNNASLESFKAHTLDIPSTIENFGMYQFASCPNLKAMIVRLVDAPESIRMRQNDKGFQKNCTLYVPAESISKYKEEEWWSGFKEIKSIEEYTPVETITADTKNAAPVAIYDLKGNKVETPSKGINVVRYSDGKSKKVVR